MNYTANASEILERKIRADADDAASRYQLAVLFLAKFDTTGGAGLLRQARQHLIDAVALRPRHAPSHSALGYTYDAEGRTEQALACFREANRLNPHDRQYEVYVFTLLQEAGQENEALARIESAAARHDVDLQVLRRELAAAGMPQDAKSLIVNGFIHARNFFRSSLADESERILNMLEPGRARRITAAERKRCAEHQQQLTRNFDASGVPETIRALAPWACRYGVGDDYCRAFLLQQLSKKQRNALIRELDGHAHAVHAWLDSFDGAPMPAEAIAFMYLALGVEEIRDQP